jgi:acetyl-CoA synthetase
MADSPVKPNLPDYQRVYKNFSWEQAQQQFICGMPGGGINIAYEAVDRHLASEHSDKIALRWISKQDVISDFTYRDLSQQSSRFASVLQQLGLQPGARVYSLAGRVPELYIGVLGALKAACIFTPLFSAFGPEPIRSRLEIGEANVLLTTTTLYKKKLVDWCHQLPHLQHVILIDADEDLAPGCHSWKKLMASANANFSCLHTHAEDKALLHFTSGTTGKPKGAIHVHQAVLMHIVSAYYALDLHPDDIYWCTADPGWVTGTSYGIIAPLCHGVTMIVDEAEYDAERWYRILEQQKVNVWYTAPTAIRLLMKAGAELRQRYSLNSLRFMASVGEPLNPEAVIWSQEVFGHPFHDNWWQTETGGIMIANYASEKVKPGSMGKPLPGITAAIVQHNEHGQLQVIDEAMRVGELALKPGWPSMFREYLNQAQRYEKCFEAGWYLSGDLCMRDAEGYYWFVGRIDDLIKSSGHLIGPFEVESVLMEHQAVAEAAVIGKPDPVAGEIVKAFVALKPGYEASENLRKELQGHARKRLGTAVAPKEIDFRHNLPKTRSGKIMRRLLKARELGLPEGDISTLESDES